MKKVTVNTLLEMKKKGEKITMLTAYDTPSARLLEAAEIEIALVGDSLGSVVLGYPNTLPVTMDEMVIHTAAVSRGLSKSMLVGDMPFLSYQASVVEAVHNAGRLVKEGRAEAVKLEGGREFKDTITAIVQMGVPVMGHLGLTPQSVNVIGGYKVQGTTERSAARLIEDAQVLEDAGCFSLVLECVPARLAGLIASKIAIPVIGIGAGPDCDGQVLVWHDLLGISGKNYKHNKQYVDLQKPILEALNNYKKEVREKAFPAGEHSFPIDEEVFESLFWE
ncbi:MAG: 3-methyl-2-oxobutanoate hydroxymethyltransferase [Candidatus Eremiobacteraeota bacterium]|nr:3-methyl-2-oxobutanoate hydroxymethyltransferase [Candidatus Eremiobacteraeota bacterium]